MSKKPITPIQRAYALLWRDMGPKTYWVREARSMLLSTLTKDEQREAIAWVQGNHPITEREILDLAERAEPG